MRGGISYISKRFIMKCYDSGIESKYITYLDANNLYGWVFPIVNLND